MDLQSVIATLLLSAETGGSMMGLSKHFNSWYCSAMACLENQNSCDSTSYSYRSLRRAAARLFGGSSLIVPQEIFAGATMSHFISLSVGVILFEGGLTLKFLRSKVL